MMIDYWRTEAGSYIWLYVYYLTCANIVIVKGFITVILSKYEKLINILE